MVQSSLVGHWPLHEWSGRANDLSGNDNHGTVNGGVTQGVAGRSGLTAHSFDGVDDEIDIGKFSELEVTYPTVSIWVRVRNDSDYIASNSRAGNTTGWRIRGRTLQIQVGGNWVNDIRFGPSGSVVDNEWHHLAFTVTDSVAITYLDGEIGEVRSVSSGGISYNSNASSEIASTQASDNFGEGEIADLRVYDRTLSQSEIDSLYRAGSVDVATPPNDSDANAVSRWSFDDRSDTSTALDEWGSNDGSINGAVYSADAIRGLSMSFDSSNNEYIDVPNTFGIFDGSSDLTISTWVNTDSTGSDKHIFSPLAEYDWQFRVYRDETLRMENFDGSNGTVVSSTEALSPNSWYHATFVYDSSETSGSVYINGVNDGSGTMQSDPQTLSADNYIGAKGGGSQYFNGQMDDLRIYDRALSDYEIQQLYLWGTRGTDRRYEVLRQ